MNSPLAGWQRAHALLVVSVDEVAGRVPQPVLVYGSYPPVPGRASAATIAAVRRAWAEGREVQVVSPRPSAAHRSVPIVGALAGYRLDRLRRSIGTSDRLVFGMERGVPVRESNRPWWKGGQLLQRTTVTGLTLAFRRFRHVSVIVTGDLHAPPQILAPLWRSAHEVVVASGDHTAAFIDRCRIPASLVRVVDVPALSPDVEGVTPLGPREVSARDRPRQVAGIFARKVLGRHAPAVRRWVKARVEDVQSLRPR